MTLSALTPAWVIFKLSLLSDVYRPVSELEYPSPGFVILPSGLHFGTAIFREYNMIAFIVPLHEGLSP